MPVQDNCYLTNIIPYDDPYHHSLLSIGIILIKNIRVMNLLAPVSSIMSKDLITIGPEDTLKKVETIFQENRIHHLPVIDQGKLVGMVSSSDYLYYKRGFKDKTVIDQQVGSLQLSGF